jgi:ubiquinone/menaquinone biosynthesis C-methylase UbiE
MEVNSSYEPYSQEPEYIEANRDLLKTVPLGDVHRVLDLACGTALMSDLLLQLKPNVVINGVDLSAESLSIGRKVMAEKGLMADTQETLDVAAAEGKGAILMEEASAMELRFADETFDMGMMGNAIHLMPDKDLFVQGLSRVLKSGASFSFNSVFFVGTYGEGSEPVYTEWMKEAFVLMMKKSDELKAAGKPPIKRKRGLSGKAFDKDWKTGEEWGALFEKHGFSITRIYKRPIGITARGLALVGAYAGLAEVLMSGYPVDLASECLQEASYTAFERHNVDEIIRYWLEVTVVKN